MRDSFVFYRSFFEAMEDLEDKDRLMLYDLICNYTLNGVEKTEKGIAATLFKIIKPQLDANNRKFEGGKKGGRPRKSGDKNPETHKPLKDDDNKPMVILNENHRLLNEKTIGYENEKPNVNDNVNVNDNANENGNENDNEKELKPTTQAERENGYLQGQTQPDIFQLKDEFSEFLKLHPNKLGNRDRGFAAFKQKRLEGVRYNHIMSGTEDYQTFVAATKPPQEQLIYPVTFLENERYEEDWLKLIPPTPPKDPNKPWKPVAETIF